MHRKPIGSIVEAMRTMVMVVLLGACTNASPTTTGRESEGVGFARSLCGAPPTVPAIAWETSGDSVILAGSAWDLHRAWEQAVVAWEGCADSIDGSDHGD